MMHYLYAKEKKKTLCFQIEFIYSKRGVGDICYLDDCLYIDYIYIAG